MTRHSDAGGVAIGIDIGGTHVRAARITRDGALSDRSRVRTDSTQNVPELVIDLCSQLLDETVEAVGVGIPGRLDREGRSILSSGYVALAGLRLGELIGQAVGRPVFLDNDAHMALRAELALGAAAPAGDVVMFTVGTGIGGAIALDGIVRRGRGNSGQLGHLGLDPAGPPCNCGRRGCSEVLLSGTALSRLVAEAGLPPGTSVEELLERWPDDQRAAEVLLRWTGAWRSAIDTIVAAVDPELVVLGGGLGAAAVRALEVCAPTGSAWFECPVTAAALGDDAGVIGAGLRAFER